MLSESFVASTLASSKAPASSALKDVGICIHALQPSSVLRSGFKKSSTAPNCLAVSASHVFAAQAEKAVVHVYSRERGGQEATIPFPERIRSVVLGGGPNGEVLVLGTESGRLILWETCTGRQISTSQSHLQPVTSLAVDPTSSFILSGSSDANIHVWSLPGLLFFARPPSTTTSSGQQPSLSPIRTFSAHRTAITALAVGHSRSRDNIAISASQDNTAVVWDYHTGCILKTCLLPSSALCLTVDPADRAFYAGYEDGSVQMIDFYQAPSTQHSLGQIRLQSAPLQLSAEDRFVPPTPDSGAAESIALSYDGMTLLSGHRSGVVLSWSVAKGKYVSTVADYTHPVTNLLMLPPSGLLHTSLHPKITVHNIVKPRYDRVVSNASQIAGTAPADYTVSAHLIFSSRATIPSNADHMSQPDQFSRALKHPFFPASLIEEGLAELTAVNQGTAEQSQGTSTSPLPEAKSLEHTEALVQSSHVQSLEAEISALTKRVSTSETARRAAVDELVRLRSDMMALQDYANELHQKQECAQKKKVSRQVEKEKHRLRTRAAWLEVEKGGKQGDSVARSIIADDGGDTTETGDISSDE
ncbi:hypothetical protein VTN02DRAFT_2139 [Thermoascus thermophilus]